MSTIVGALALVAAGGGLLGCADMRQNMRGEFVSYRGAWFCGAAGCEEAKMQRSSQAHREGDITINHGKLSAGAALVFNAGKAPETFSATVSDCAGKSASVPDDKVEAPGSHKIAGQAESYVVRIDPKDYPALTLGKGCKKWMVTTHATWPKGTSWEQKAGIEQK